MRHSFLDAMSWEMAEVYGAITDQILINLAHYFPFYKPGASVPKSAFEYQASMLAQMGQVNRDTIQIIKNGLKGAQTALNGVLEQSIIDAVKKAEPSLLSAVKRGILNPATNPIKVSPNQYHAFELYYGQAAEKLNLVNTVMLESTKQAYQATVADIANRVQVTQTALDIGTGEAVTGVSSWNQALRHSIERMKQNGITGFIDHGGHRWSAEAYVAMDIRTTVYNTGRAAVWECNQDFGNDLYIVSYHDGARPGCYDWQNKVISSIDAARDVVDLDGNVVHVYAQSDTTYGEPAGLFGINCKHYPSPWIPGVSVGYDPANIQDEAENKEVYEQTQGQRRLERKLREEKRDVLMAKAQGADDEEITRLRDKARQTSADIQTFCDETGLPRRANREGVYTERSFPDASTYDVTQFESTQQRFIKDYFETGGVQTDYVTGDMMTPNVPLTPNTPAVPPVPVAPQVQMKYGEPFNTDGMRKPQVKQIESAKQTLTNAPENVRKAWDKCADRMQRMVHAPQEDGAFYRHATGKTYFESYKKAFEESSYQRRNAVFFHEFGHNIDDLLGDGTQGGYLSLSYVSKDGHLFSQIIQRECGDTLGRFYCKMNGFADAYDAVKAAQNGAGGMGFTSFTRMMLKGVMPRDEWLSVRDMLSGDNVEDSVLRPLVDKWLKPQFQSELRGLVKGKTDVADEFIKWVKSSFTIYERADVSDMYEHYMIETFGKKYEYPFGIGHGTNYASASSAAKEAFAEMFGSTVIGGDSLRGIKTFFPESYAFFEEMLGSVL